MKSYIAYLELWRSKSSANRIMLVSAMLIQPTPPLVIMTERGATLAQSITEVQNNRRCGAVLMAEPTLEQRISEMQTRNQRRGVVVLSVVVAVCIWLFSVVP
jgi:hypothetical protein